jgi:exoribonuclease II
MILRPGSLVLYKGRPARIVAYATADKLEIEAAGETSRVRPKDVVPLHPGPCQSLSELKPMSGEVEAAWEILAGTQTSLKELAELAYGSFTPATAWAAWQQVSDGLRFRGQPDAIVAATIDEVDQRIATRASEEAQRQSWESFLDRVRQGRIAEHDHPAMADVVGLALGQRSSSRVLKALGRDETPQAAHALLLDCGMWSDTFNPYPARLGVSLVSPQPEMRELPDEERVDLTHLASFAIDDAATDTPDDAVSIADGGLWVHIADPAWAIRPGDPADIEARERGATSYLPERITPMLPEALLPIVSLGCAEVSPAFSFRLEIDAEGQIGAMTCYPSRVRVTRLTYEEVGDMLEKGDLADLYAKALAYRGRRVAHGAIQISLPEVDLRVKNGDIIIKPVLDLPGRTLVSEAMIMVGEAVAQYAINNDLPMPYATQDAPDAWEPPTGLAESYALRRTLRPRQYRSVPGLHAGLGLAAYAQATSPLRRYLDLVVHQQLRAHLAGRSLLTGQEILERVGAVEAGAAAVRQAERLSDKHWTLLYLKRNPAWRGTGVLVEKRRAVGICLIPELDLEAELHLAGDLPLDSEITLECTGIDLPRLEARFRKV